MDYGACNVVLVDRTATEDRVVRRSEEQWRNSWGTAPEPVPQVDGNGPIDANLGALLKTFNEVHLCSSAKSCIEKLSDFNTSSKLDLIPTLVLLDIPQDEIVVEDLRHSRTPSPSSRQGNVESIRDVRPESLYGLELLRWVAAEIQYQSLSKLIVPIAVISTPRNAEEADDSANKSCVPIDPRQLTAYLDAGAVDVVPAPLQRERLPSLAIHAYRAHREVAKDQKALLEVKRGRKRSWVGVDDKKPYAYLREAMVSNLMAGICKLDRQVGDISGHIGPFVVPDRRIAISAAVGSWSFSAHDFSDDELLCAAELMLQHALAIPELEKFRIPTEMLSGFLVSCRSAYNAFVPYHNFRHVIDVLQATFYFLVRTGSLPPFPSKDGAEESTRSPLATLIRPFDALTLLITAIGHDVGHPGVNNAFLVALNAPLAQLYNDKSVLEAFHCAAYSQILRRHWPSAFHSIEMRQLMINCILATDMGLHFDYMQKLGHLQEKLHANNGGIDGWGGRFLEDQRTLACALLIKCADISNVARKYDCAVQWTMILTEEFSRQASMEVDLEIPSTLYAAPNREIVALSKSQIGFINMLALPLFQGVADVMHEMQFSVDEITKNKQRWQDRITEEQARQEKSSSDSVAKDGMLSPRSLSVAVAPGQKTELKTEPPNLNTLMTKTGLERETGDLSQEDLDSSNNSSDTRSHASGAFPSESLSSSSFTITRHSSKPVPSQLQLNQSSSSVSGDETRRDDKTLRGSNNGIDGIVNGMDAEYSVSPQMQQRQRSSDATEGSGSASGPCSGDWASQATSATTSKLPLSPSTQGTSITSRTSVDRLPTRRDSATDLGFLAQDPSAETDKGGSVTIMQTVRSLSKKPSKFRLNFWKKKHERATPVGAEEAAG